MILHLIQTRIAAIWRNGRQEYYSCVFGTSWTVRTVSSLLFQKDPLRRPWFISLLHTILESVDGGEMYVRMFFSDFSKGFDLVDHNVLLRELDNLDVDPHLVRWIAAFLTNRNQRVRVGEALSPPVWLNGGTPQGTKLTPLLFCILVNRMASNCTNRVKYVDDATVMEFVLKLSPSYLNFTVYSFASSRGMVLNGKKMQGNVH